MILEQFGKRLLAGILSVVMVATPSMNALGYSAPTQEVVTVNTEDGTITTDESWIEQFPTGTFAFKDNYLNISEGDSTTRKVTVYRLGGTKGTAKAHIAVTPAVSDDGTNVYYDNAAGSLDFTMQAERPLSECVEKKYVDLETTLEMTLDMESAYLEVLPPAGYDAMKVLLPETIANTSIEGLSGAVSESAENAMEEAESRATYQWYRFDATTKEWTALEGETQQILMMTYEDEFNENYNFACVVTLDGQMYASKPLWEMYFDDYQTTQMTCITGVTEVTEENTKYADVETDSVEPYRTTFIELEFDEGEWIKDILVTTINDEAHEANEFALFTIYEAEGAVLYDSANRFTLGIEDDEEAISSLFGFEVESIEADKATGTAKVTVKRMAGKQYVGEVSYRTVDGTAVAGVDYAETTGKLAFNCGVESMTIEVPLINDEVLSEGANVSFSIELYDPLAGTISEGKETITVNLYNSLQDFGVNNTATRLTATDSVDLTQNVVVAEEEIIDTANEMDIDVAAKEAEIIDAEVEFAPAVSRSYNYGEMSINVGGTNNWKIIHRSVYDINIFTQQRETKTYTINKMYEQYSQVAFDIYGYVERGYKAIGGWDYARSGLYLTNTSNNPREELFWINRADSDGNVEEEKKVTIDIESRVEENGYSALKNKNVVRGEITRRDNQDNDVSARLRVSTTYVRKLLQRQPSLIIHTADDDYIETLGSDGLNFINKNLKPSVSIDTNNGGTSDGYIFIGSELIITPNAQSAVYSLYNNASKKSIYLQDLTDSSKPIVNYANISNGTAYLELGEGSADSDITYTGRVESNHQYSVNLIFDRIQNIVFDVTPSTDANADGISTDSEIKNARATASALLANATYKTRVVDFSSDDNFSDPQKVNLKLSNSEDDNAQLLAANLKNVQSVNFNLPNADRIVFNGKSYAGDADIPIDTLNMLQNKNLSFIYYQADFVNAQTTMKIVAYDRIEQYIDMNDNGVVDDSDILMAVLVDDKYESSEFAPVEAYDEATDSMIKHQQILKVHYTIVPKSLGIPEGATEKDTCLIIPSFVTSITDEVEKEKLSKEMQGYRDIEESGTGDNLMYGAAATLGDLDIPLGGDFSPPEYVVTGTEMNKTGTDEYEVGEYRWTPDFKGNLREIFEAPDKIVVNGTVMPDGYEAATDKDSINHYLGSFGSNDTISLNVRLKEEGKEVSESVKLAPFVSFQGLGSFSMDQDQSKDISAPEDNTGTTDGAPNVTKAQPGFNLPTAQIPLGPASLIMNGYEVGFSVGIPLFSAQKTKTDTINTSPISPSQNKVSKGSWSQPEYGNTVTKSAEAISTMRDAINSRGGSIADEFRKVKNGTTTGTYNTNNVKPKANAAASFDVAVNMTFMWKYSTVDSQFHFDSAMFFVAASGSIKQTVRLSVCPIVYVYVIFGIEMNVGAGVQVEESVDAKGNRQQDVQFSGLTISPTLFIEAGAGIGVEIAKVEVYLKVSVGFSASFGKNMEGASFDKFEFMAGFGVRAVFLFFSFQMDAIQIKMGYDKKLIEKGEDDDGWFFKWFAFGKEQKGRSIEGDYEELSSMPVQVNLPQNTYYSEYVYAPEENIENPLSRAFDIEGMPFQISGYSSSASASRLVDGLSTGSAYQLITVGTTNYVLYEKSVDAQSSGIDANQLVISKIKEVTNNGVEGLGLVHPFDETSTVPYLKIDNDNTGDLDFVAYVNTEGNVNVAWVSYETTTDNNQVNSVEADDALLCASQKTMVKTAVIDMSNSQVKNIKTVSGTPSGSTKNTNYKFLPDILGDELVLYVESAQYTDEEKDSVNQEYKDYYEADTNAVYSDTETGQIYGTGDPYAGFQYQYAVNMNNLYGKYSVLNFSVKQADGNYSIVTVDPTDSWKDNNTIIEQVSGKKIGEDYYLAYAASEKALLTGADSSDVETIKRLYVQKVSLADDATTGMKTVKVSNPVIIANLVDADEESDKDGVYVNGTLKESFTDPYFADISFIHAKLDGDTAEDALLYNMNSSFYCIDAEALGKIFTDNVVNVTPLFTIDTENGDTKSDVSIGTDGDGNISAVYTDTVGNTTNNALYVIKYDSDAKVWGEGRMLAMNHMQVYEDALNYGWSDEQMKAAFYQTTEDANGNGTLDEGEDLNNDGAISAVSGGMDQFIFSDPQIALGKSSSDQEDGTLLVVAEGIFTELVEQTYQIDGERVKQIEPSSAIPSELGFYAISYGVGEQAIGDVSLSFLDDNFVPGARLQPIITFTNKGDVAIRGSEANPITLDLWITAAKGSGEGDTILASWNIKNSIAPGAVVNTSMAELDDSGAIPYADALPETVNGRTLYFTLSEDADYVANAYTYTSNTDEVADGTGKHVIKESYAELGFDTVYVGAEGNTSINTRMRSMDKYIDVSLNMDVYNKGTTAAENLQILIEYATGEKDEDGNEIYAPIEQTGILLAGEEVSLVNYSRAMTGNGVFTLVDESGNPVSINAGYMRNVSGTITLPSSYYDMTSTTQSMNLRFTLVSENEEYNNENNVLYTSLEAASLFGVPDQINMVVGSRALIPVTVDTTRVGNPNVSVYEVVTSDDQRILNNIYYNAVTNVIVATANTTGSGVIRIADTSTGSFTDMAFVVNQEGVNIFNDNPALLFKNNSTDGWEFAEGQLAGEDGPYYNYDVAIGHGKDTLEFETNASAIEFYFTGSLNITSTNDFGFTGTTITSDDYSQPVTVMFGNDALAAHEVKVEVASDEAHLDKYVELYGIGITLPKDDNAPLIILGKSKPKASSLGEDETFVMPAYIVDDNVISNVSANGEEVEMAAENFAKVNLTIDKNGSYYIVATDEYGNRRTEVIVVDWFGESVTTSDVETNWPTASLTCVDENSAAVTGLAADGLYLGYDVSDADISKVTISKVSLNEPDSYTLFEEPEVSSKTKVSGKTTAALAENGFYIVEVTDEKGHVTRYVQLINNLALDGPKLTLMKNPSKAKELFYSAGSLDSEAALERVIIYYVENTSSNTFDKLPETGIEINELQGNKILDKSFSDGEKLVSGTAGFTKGTTFVMTAIDEVGNRSIACFYGIPVQSVALDKKEAANYVYDTIQLTTTVKPTDAINQDVTWTSSDEKIATVDDNGLVTLLNVGMATITATTVDGGFTAQCKVTAMALPIDTYKDDIELSRTHYLFTAKEIEPAVSIFGLTEGTDFTVAYENNKQVGEATVIVTGINNYTGEIRTTFSIEYLKSVDEEDNPLYGISGVMGDAGYYIADVKVYPVSGYEISKDQETGYTTAGIPITTDGNNNISFYIKRTSDGAITDMITAENILVDQTPPTGSITLENVSWNDTMLEDIYFDRLDVDNRFVSITAKDSVSGLKEILYTIANREYKKVSYLLGAKLTWEEYDETAKPIVDMNKKQVVYVKLTDNAGNTVYLNSEGIILDDRAPEFLELAILDNETLKETQADILFALSEPGTYYYAMLPVDMEAPDAESLKSQNVPGAIMGTGTINEALAGTRIMLTVSGLEAGTSYKLYMMADDTTAKTNGTPSVNTSTVKESLVVTTKQFVPVIIEAPVIQGIYGTMIKDMTLTPGVVTFGGETINGTWSVVSEEIPGTDTNKKVKVTFTPESKEYGETFSYVIPKVDPKLLTAEGVAVSDVTESFVYNGEEFKPTVTVSDSMATMTEADFEITYENNVNAGTATVVVTGKNNYTGTVERTFVIEKKATTVTVEEGKTSYEVVEDGDAFWLTGISTDSNGTITYVSSDESVVTVDADGMVQIVGTGTAVIFVFVSETENGKAPEPAEITIVVKEKVSDNPDKYYLGDVDMNGNVTAEDALLALKVVVKLETLNEQQMFLGDTNGNLLLEAADALEILKVVVKLAPLKEVTLP